MTALLHRYCPDHSAGKALCGMVLDSGVGFTVVDEAVLDAAPGDACLVCGDLSPMACEDACLGARSEATS